jgi:hypothetical protein
MVAQAKKPSRKLDKSTALKLKVENKLTYQQIADLQGVCKQAVHKAIAHLLPTEEAKTYRENRADILSQIQLNLLSQVDSARLKKVSVRDAIVSMGILFDKEQEVRGTSPADKMYDAVALAVRYAELRAMLRDAQDVDKPVDNNSVIDIT